MTCRRWCMLLLFLMLCGNVAVSVYLLMRPSPGREALQDMFGYHEYTVTLPPEAEGNNSPILPLWWEFPDGRRVSVTNTCWEQHGEPIDVKVYLWNLDRETFDYALVRSDGGRIAGTAKNLLHRNGSISYGWDNRIQGTKVRSGQVTYTDIGTGAWRDFKLVVGTGEPQGAPVDLFQWDVVHPHAKNEEGNTACGCRVIVTQIDRKTYRKVEGYGRAVHKKLPGVDGPGRFLGYEVRIEGNTYFLKDRLSNMDVSYRPA